MIICSFFVSLYSKTCHFVRFNDGKGRLQTARSKVQEDKVVLNGASGRVEPGAERCVPSFIGSLPL